MAVCVFCLFHTIPWAGLRSVSVAFPGHCLNTVEDTDDTVHKLNQLGFANHASTQKICRQSQPAIHNLIMWIVLDKKIDYSRSADLLSTDWDNLIL